MILHILTACSRPEYLPAWAAELCEASKCGVDIRWHVGFDMGRKHVGGQRVKNLLLDSIPADCPGWVWIGDDDNVLDPTMLAALTEYDAQEFDAVIFAQHRGARVARPCAVIDRVDAAQLVARRRLIGGHRLPEAYNGDGYWISEIAKHGYISYDARPLTKYNARVAC